jgi:hypothetical protein
MNRMTSSVKGACEAAQELGRSDSLEFTLLETLPAEVDIPYEVTGAFLGHELTVTKTPREVCDESLPIRGDYNMLAWSVFYFGKRHIEENVPANKLERFKSLTRPTGEAHSGIRTMVAYASMLSFAYAGQRPKFPNVPTHPDDKLDELWHIARKSPAAIALLAAQPTAIDLRIERDADLYPGKYMWGAQESLMRGSTNQLKMELNDEGALTIGIHNLERRIEAVSETYARDQGRMARGAGCAAIRSTMDDGVTTPFERYWQTIVDVATTDPRFFAADLAMADEFRRDYGLDRTYNYAK